MNFRNFHQTSSQRALLTMSTNNFKLNSLKDWEQWDWQFTSTAIAADLWEMIQGQEASIQKPIESKIDSYLTSTAVAALQTHSQSQTTATEDSQSMIQQVSQQKSVEFINLSTTDQKFYLVILIIYKNKLKVYNNQQLVIQKLINLINQTVSSSYHESCCESEKKINNWYINLQKSADTSINQEYDYVKNQYNKALQSLTKIKNHEKWITE